MLLDSIAITIITNNVAVLVLISDFFKTWIQIVPGKSVEQHSNIVFLIDSSLSENLDKHLIAKSSNYYVERDMKTSMRTTQE